MSTKIKGLKYIDSNNYTKIIIREENGNYRIDAKEDVHPYPTIPKEYKFQDDLKGCTDAEKVISVVERFLEYNTITQISDHQYLSHYDGTFSVVKGHRELDISMSHRRLKIIPSIIVDKYLKDRLSFCERNKCVNKIELYTDDRGTSYKLHQANFGDFIQFNILTQNKKTAGFEQEFLENFLTERLYLEGEEAVVREQTIYSRTQDAWISLGLYVNCGDLSIKINSNSLMPLISSVVNNYNEENQRVKKMQIKMEEF